MRMIFDSNVENQDFLELIISEKEAKNISVQGAGKDFEKGLYGTRPLNVYIRLEKPYERGDAMPLVKGKKARTREGFSENVKKEMEAGKPQKQAVAIAYSEARRSEKGK